MCSPYAIDVSYINFNSGVCLISTLSASFVLIKDAAPFKASSVDAFLDSSNTV